MTWRHFCKDVALFAVMITVEFTTVGSTTLFKAATERGLSYYVYIVYSYVVSTLNNWAPFNQLLCSSEFSSLERLTLLQHFVGLEGSSTVHPLLILP
ncbi:hypothetical protein L6164_007390 [Bauhinia variegata]|uniref:Uncharacterized protein n=1 Tax=Bauhinia variegata TaxID=167791 RepID=A0ACB9PDA9_BAUVA|nr:hypothetical protein L6164_007390 [Bauhinia variegata]